MAEVNEVCSFEIGCDQIEFRTQTNGDRIKITGIELLQEQATSLAWLINSGEGTTLKIRIKIKND